MEYLVVSNVYYDRVLIMYELERIWNNNKGIKWFQLISL